MAKNHYFSYELFSAKGVIVIIVEIFGSLNIEIFLFLDNSTYQTIIDITLVSNLVKVKDYVDYR